MARLSPFYADLLQPDMQQYGRVMGITAWRARNIDEFSKAISAAMAIRGPTLVEVDMPAFGPYPVTFACPRMQ
jgi:acetolactate synthase I/II/III large subunit